MKPAASLFVSSVVLFLTTAAFAESGAGPPADHPCQKVAAACRAAGYYQGGAKEGKGLWKDCVAPIARGQAVKGVTVDPADAKACQATPPRRPNPPPAR